MLTAKEVVKKFSDVKTLPHVAIRVTQLANDENSTMQDFEEIIKLDPILITRLLRLVNSPYFGLGQKVESIAKAVVYTGMKQLRNMVAVEGLRNLYGDDKGDEVFSREKLWLHSATVAILCDMIAKRIFGLDGEDAFLAGIIHDIGLIAEDQVAGDLLRKACKDYKNGGKSLKECEKDAIGTSHCEVGGAMARDWKLPDEVLKAIRFHHDTQKEHPVSSIASILQLAEYMANKLKYSPLSGAVDPLPPSLAKHVKEMMADYKTIARILPDEMAKAKELYDPSAAK